MSERKESIQELVWLNSEGYTFKGPDGSTFLLNGRDGLREWGQRDSSSKSSSSSVKATEQIDIISDDEELDDFNERSCLSERSSSDDGYNVYGENGEPLEQISEEYNLLSSDETESPETWNAFFFSILLAQAKNPKLKYMILTLYFLTTLYGASAGWFGPQATLEELYDVDNEVVKDYADASCVELNTLLRFFYLHQTLKLLDNAYNGVASLGWLDWFIVPTVLSVTGGDTCLGVLAGTAAQHWQKPRLYSVAGITALELLFLNFRNVTQTYGLLSRKFYHPDQLQLIKHITAIRLHLYTLEPLARLQELKTRFDIPVWLRTETEIMDYLMDGRNQEHVMDHAKKACDDLGLLSEGKHITAISIITNAYTLIGGIIASYEWIKYLNEHGSPSFTTGLSGFLSTMAKTCGYAIALSTLIDIIINVKLLLSGAKTTSSQNKKYFLAVVLAVLGFILTVPPSGLSFFLPTHDILSYFFPNWVEAGDTFYQIVLPVLGAMGSIANSIGYIGMCKILLDAFRKTIDKDTLQGRIDVCKLLDDLETNILRKTAPDRQSLVFLFEVTCLLFKSPVGPEEYDLHNGYSEVSHYISSRIPERPDLPYVPARPHSSQSFFGPKSRSPEIMSSSRELAPSRRDYGTMPTPRGITPQFV